MYFYSMIQVNELRVGDWVSRENTGHALTITVEHLYHWDKFKSVLFPLKLTHEILEQCGFEKISVDIYRCNYFDIHFDGERYWFETKAGEVVRETEIEALHQLQNLYFALTGEELQIKQLATA